VNDVFADHGATVDAALTLAHEVAGKSPTAVWASKQAINYAREHSVADSLQQMALLQMGVWQSADIAEAVRANAEKRPAQFDDLAAVPRFGAAA
jgi:enoyl-CoA hydratase